MLRDRERGKKREVLFSSLAVGVATCHYNLLCHDNYSQINSPVKAKTNLINSTISLELEQLNEEEIKCQSINLSVINFK